MSTATVTSKGQITIPIEIRNQLGLKPGDRVDFSPGSFGVFEMRARNGSVKELAGMFPQVHRVVSLAEMDEAIARGAAGLPEPSEEGAA